MEQMKNELTPRIATLREALMHKGFTNRSKEWFVKSELPNVGKMHPDKHVIVRRAIAIDEMLKALCDKKKHAHTHCFEIEDGSLLAGIIPMGSNGLGKVFPNYLTDEEIRVGSVTNKSQMAILGHNSINYENVLNKGIGSIIEFAQSKLDQKLLKGVEIAYDKQAFYEAVVISCKAVVNYANNFALLAKHEAAKCNSIERKAELLEMARICQKVPEHPAETFYEAVHSIWLVHCCLHSTMDYMSLGRLDQVLNPFLEKESNKEFACELIENFIIKAAGRLNLTTQYLVEQDHMDYNAALGIHPYYLDQRAGLNNFLQNIIIGGKKPSGEDATNGCTFLLLDAFRNVNLSTPGLYVRLHKNSPRKLINAVAHSIKTTKNLPYILNDEVMIPAMRDALSYGEKDHKKLKQFESLANDYCVDGCWEPILNGVSEWTFGMINGMTILECALNGGAALSANPELLRGQKLSIDTGKIESYKDLEEALKKQMQFFVDQSAFAMCMYYMTNEFVVPTPLVSALFESCLEKGIDKSWGGADYNIGGTILGGVPDMINTVAAIKHWVFDKKKYELPEVTAAMRYNFTAGDSGDVKTQRLFDSIKVDLFTNSPQFGNGQSTNSIAKHILDEFYQAVLSSKDLAHKVFLDPAGDTDPKIVAMRAVAGYYGEALQTIMPGFNLTFTAGLGTFEQYNWQGTGIAASAARNSGDPLAPNFTPTSGTWHTAPGQLLKTFHHLKLDRFAGGVITDMCLDTDVPVEQLIENFITHKGGMLTLTMASPQYQEIYEIAKASNNIEDKAMASEKLVKYADIMVRVGGWNAPFVSLPLPHMENYINRPVGEKN
ncbi:formate acetyltransferase [Prolixibacteraceae bacterium JC049]|nr:formate acetyltransferase [Prolixibacteraceae bacterium JC049]